VRGEHRCIGGVHASTDHRRLMADHVDAGQRGFDTVTVADVQALHPRRGRGFLAVRHR